MPPKIKPKNPENADFIREKTYIAKDIETSITLLDSPENAIIIDALIFLSKYADLQQTNLKILLKQGILPKILLLLAKNAAISRLSLRLLSQLLQIDECLEELDQNEYDEKLLDITRMYVSSKDLKVYEFSLEIMEKLSKTNRLDTIVATENLLTIILQTIKTPRIEELLPTTLKLFLNLLDNNDVTTEVCGRRDFDLNVFLDYLGNPGLIRIILDIFYKLCANGSEIIQNIFQNFKILQNLIRIIMDPDKKDYHDRCMNILDVSLNYEDTIVYLVKTYEFLELCQFIQDCSQDKLLEFADFLVRITRIDSLKQLLFDLSVEDAILSILRVEDRKVINKSFVAMANMISHRYCCEKMLVPLVLKRILWTLDEDEKTGKYEHGALDLLHSFVKKDTRTVHMISHYNGNTILFKYLEKEPEEIGENNFVKILEIFLLTLCQPLLQNTVTTQDFYRLILKYLENKSEKIASISLEILLTSIKHDLFQDNFMSLDGPGIVLKQIGNAKNLEYLTIFIHNTLIYKPVTSAFLRKGLLKKLRETPENLQETIPMIPRVIKLLYNNCLPMKFFEYNRLELTDRLNERFHLINGPWTDHFPFIEVLELKQISTLYTVYVVEYFRKKIQKKCPKECEELRLESGLSFCSDADDTVSTPTGINYGKLSPDPYLPQYFARIAREIDNYPDIVDRIKFIAKFVDKTLSGPDETFTPDDRMHCHKIHVESLKKKLGTNMIPLGYLRLGFHCERALLFKTICDQFWIPATLVRAPNGVYFNEIALIDPKDNAGFLGIYLVDLMAKIGELHPMGSREYCKYSGKNF